MTIEITPKTWIFLGICLASFAVGIWLLSTMSTNPSTEASADNTTPIFRPKPPAVHKSASQPKERVIYETLSTQGDTQNVLQALELLKLPPGTERTEKWRKLTEMADYHELVRMSELPAQPKLDADRINLRYLAVRQMGKLGFLDKFTQERQTFDNKTFGSSSVLRMALQEWARIDGKACLDAWTSRIYKTAKHSILELLANSIATGLVEGDGELLASHLKNLPEQESAILWKAIEQIGQEQKAKASPATKNSPTTSATPQQNP